MTAPSLPALLVLAFLAFVPSNALGQGADHTPTLTLHGFGTVGFVHSSEDQADFAGSYLRPNGPGHSEAISPDVDSRLGLQAAAHLTTRLSAVVQVVAEQTYRDDYEPGLEWAYLDYEFTPRLSVRAGRKPVNVFLVSDHRKISYANPWLRPPVELYGLVPITRGEAVEATYRLHTGSWTNTLVAAVGRGTGRLRNGRVEAEDTWQLSYLFERGGLTGRLSHTSGRGTLDALAGLFDGFREFGPEGEAIAERYGADDTPFHITSLGARFDPGAWLLVGELGWVDFNSALGEKLAGYLTTGYRIGSVTPYLTYSRVKTLSETSADGLSLEGMPPESAEVAARLNAELDLVLRASPEQQNLAVGGRWDVTPGLAFKAQVDFIDVLDESTGTFINWQPGFEPGGSAQLLSLAVTFVF